jgi:HAD superfamily hydrolase (TIGR01549 family)
VSDSYAAWLVDLDGTLYRAPPVKLAMAAELALLGWASIATLRQFRHEHEAIRAIAVDGPNPYRAQVERTAEHLGRDPAAVDAIVTEWMHARPGKWIRLFRRQPLLEEIARFKGSGGRVALVSDYPATAKLAALGIADLFAVVVASGEPGGPRRLKPDPEGYLAAAERLGVAPGECLVIGDRADADGGAAAAAGMAFRKV